MITGGCRCGAIRYRLQGEPLATRMCWCRDCQYWAGGNATVNVVVLRAGLQLEGTPAQYESVAASGHHMSRSFCSACGTQLFSSAGETPERLVIRAGSLDDPSLVAPQSIIWTDSAPAWVVLDPNLPHCPAQPT